MPGIDSCSSSTTVGDSDIGFAESRDFGMRVTLGNI